MIYVFWPLSNVQNEVEIVVEHRNINLLEWGAQKQFQSLVVDENEKRTRGLFWWRMWTWLLCNFMFLLRTQYYSTSVVQSITCRKIQCFEDKYVYFMFGINFKWSSATFYFVKDLPRPSTNNGTHLLFKEQFIFSFRVCAKIEANSLREQGLNIERVWTQLG